MMLSLVIIVIGHLAVVLGDVRLLDEVAKIHTSYILLDTSSQVTRMSKQICYKFNWILARIIKKTNRGKV
jgi:hypothetical protein